MPRTRGSLILPWPNTRENIQRQVDDLLRQGFTAEVVTGGPETYVRTNAEFKPKKDAKTRTRARVQRRTRRSIRKRTPPSS